MPKQKTHPPFFAPIVKFILALSLTTFIAFPLHAQNQRLVFDLTNPQEAAKWQVTSNDDSKGPPGLGPDGFFVASNTEANVMMERDVNFQASNFNRLIVELKTDAHTLTQGFAAASFFFSDGSPITADSRLVKSFPDNTMFSIVFELEQSLLWSGTIKKIRLDPCMGAGLSHVVSLTFDKEPPPPPAPSWDLTTKQGTLGWSIGEFDVENGGFIPHPPMQNEEGISFTAQGFNAVIQNLDIKLNASSIKSLDMLMKNHTGVPTQAIFYWATQDPPNFDDAKNMILPVDASNQWQTIHFELSNHPAWKDQIKGLIINPTRTPGTLTVKNLKFNAIEGLGQRGQQNATFNWLTHQEVSSRINRGEYKPLLVLITKQGNSFSQKIERELASDREFIRQGQQFFPVRIESTDPVATRTFGKFYRIPVMIVMTWDPYQKRWVEQARHLGPEVSKNAVQTLQNTPK